MELSNALTTDNADRGMNLKSDYVVILPSDDIAFCLNPTAMSHLSLDYFQKENEWEYLIRRRSGPLENFI